MGNCCNLLNDERKGKIKMFCCEECGNEVIKSYGEEKKIKMRTNIAIWDLKTDICIIKCLKCKNEVSVPLSLHLSGGRVIGYGKKK